MNCYQTLACFLLVHSGAAATLLYDNAPFPMGGRLEGSLTEEGFSTTGRFTHSGAQVPGRSSNDSMGFLSVIDGDQVVVRPTSGAFFNAVSIDLAEYSNIFRFPARIQFFGTRSDGGTVSTTFVTDGLFDGPGGIPDFQTFAFPSSFNSLQSISTKTINIFGEDNPFSMDNLQVYTVPEPTAASLLVGISLIASFRRRILKVFCGRDEVA